MLANGVHCEYLYALYAHTYSEPRIQCSDVLLAPKFLTRVSAHQQNANVESAFQLNQTSRLKIFLEDLGVVSAYARCVGREPSESFILMCRYFLAFSPESVYWQLHRLSPLGRSRHRHHWPDSLMSRSPFQTLMRNPEA